MQSIIHVGSTTRVQARVAGVLNYLNPSRSETDSCGWILEPFWCFASRHSPLPPRLQPSHYRIIRKRWPGLLPRPRIRDPYTLRAWCSVWSYLRARLLDNFVRRATSTRARTHHPARWCRTFAAAKFFGDNTLAAYPAHRRPIARCSAASPHRSTTSHRRVVAAPSPSSIVGKYWRPRPNLVSSSELVGNPETLTRLSPTTGVKATPSLTRRVTRTVVVLPAGRKQDGHRGRARGSYGAPLAVYRVFAQIQSPCTGYYTSAM